MSVWLRNVLSLRPKILPPCWFCNSDLDWCLMKNRLVSIYQLNVRKDNIIYDIVLHVTIHHLNHRIGFLNVYMLTWSTFFHFHRQIVMTSLVKFSYHWSVFNNFHTNLFHIFQGRNWAKFVGRKQFDPPWVKEEKNSDENRI